MTSMTTTDCPMKCFPHGDACQQWINHPGICRCHRRGCGS